MICFAQRSADGANFPYLSLSHGVPRVNDRRVVSGIVYVIKHGLQWKDILALGGWVIALETRLQEVTTKQEERARALLA